ncbi:hypothetical protein PIB30_113381, partial [Stylosanthes scabra]|nr:hypothetical protein [Stylosanthes scabra]
MGLVNGLQDGPFSQSVSKKHATSIVEIQERAEKYINMEEATRLRNVGPSREFEVKKNRDARRELDLDYSKARKYHSFTPLRMSLVEVYRDICNVEKLPTPRPIRSRSAGGKSDYCEYH